MESLDTTILNTAVPIVAQALEIPLLSMKSVLASYTLSLAVFIPISGWMADPSERAGYSRPRSASSPWGPSFAASRATSICSSPAASCRDAAEP